MIKPTIGIYGLTGCAGDQLTLLNCEDELMEILGSINLKSFIMAQTGNYDCEVDIAFVDGTVTQERDLEDLQEIRKKSGMLIAMGTCAVWGGVAAMNNDIERNVLKEKVYGKKGEFIKSLKVFPLSHYVNVDFNLTGCPIEKEELLKSIAYLLHGDLPILTKYPVCTECKMNEYECVLVKHDTLCLGPITAGGCKARCPGLNIPCKGCRGLVVEANIASEINLLKEKGYTLQDIKNSISIFTAPAVININEFTFQEKEKCIKPFK